MTYPGDLANQVAQQLQDAHVAAALSDPEHFVAAEEPMIRETRKSIFTKIDFKWRPYDAKQLDQIRVGVDHLFKDLFDEAFDVIDNLYAEMRVAQTNPETGVVLKDGSGRVIWQKDSSGRELEQWSQLTGQDIEKCLLDIARLKLELAPKLNDLLLEAVFAKHIADDAHQDKYAELVEETVAGRNAYASRHAREEKYFAFFKYYLYSHAEAFKREIDNFARVLERIRYFRVQDSEDDRWGRRAR